jgi:tetratricopeptide (TPR) repeat protein
MVDSEGIARRYYRLGLAAAKRRDLSAAFRYAVFARILDPEHDDAAHLEEICRYELGEAWGPVLERFGPLVERKKWAAAARAAGSVPGRSVRLLNIQGCLWALAKHYASATDCFAKALAKDRGNTLAAAALAEIGRRRKCFWRFFCFSLTK